MSVYLNQRQIFAQLGQSTVSDVPAFVPVKLNAAMDALRAERPKITHLPLAVQGGCSLIR